MYGQFFVLCEIYEMIPGRGLDLISNPMPLIRSPRVELRTRGTRGTRGDLRQRRYISSVDKVTMAGVESLRQGVRHRTGVWASKNQEYKKKSETFAFDYRAIDCFSRSLHFTASFNDQEARKFQFHLCKWL